MLLLLCRLLSIVVPKVDYVAIRRIVMSGLFGVVEQNGTVEDLPGYWGFSSGQSRTEIVYGNL